MKKYKGILFDLDGTLLPMETESFLNAYGKALIEHFKAFNCDREFFNNVMSSVNYVIQNKEYRVNKDKFFDHFNQLIEGDISAYEVHFDDFYVTAFDETKSATSKSSDMVEAVRLLKEKGYILVIATNPVFPMVANEKRIHWAGLDINDFNYVSSLESNHFCKPNTEFFKEVLESNNLNADEVLMVGNDMEEDLISSTIGIDNFIITDHLIDRKQFNLIPKYQGDYKAFLDFVRGL